MDTDVDKIAQARAQLESLCAAFDVEVPPPGDEGRVLLLIQRGQVSWDAESGKGKYVLAVPLALKNGETFREFSFHEPIQEEIDRIQKGISSEGDLEQINIMLSKVLTVVCGVAVGISSRFLRRDVSDLKELFGLLRFFG